jgi:hypothetical protein
MPVPLGSRHLPAFSGYTAMLRKRASLVLVVVLLVSAGFALGVRSAWDRWGKAAPVLECPALIDLGERDRGETAVARFRVRNNGRGELRIDGFQTSCSCAGVERESQGKFHRIQSVRVQPGEQVELVARVAVQAPPGQRQHVQVFLTSNDPTTPVKKLDLVVPRVRGPVHAAPAAVLFNTVSVGAMARQSVRLYDNGRPGRKIARVRSTHPGRFTVDLIPLSKTELEEEDASAGRLIGRLEVKARTERHGTLDGDIEVFLADESSGPAMIPVSGEVIRPVECWPETLVLPRRVGDRSDYSGRVLLRSRSGKPIKVEVDSVQPANFVVACSDAGREDQRWIHVEYRPGQGKKNQPAPMSSIHLRAWSEGAEAKIEVPILIAEDSP